MAKVVTAILSVTYDTLSEYEADVLNVGIYEANVSNPVVQDKILDEPNLKISCKIVQTI